MKKAIIFLGLVIAPAVAFGQITLPKVGQVNIKSLKFTGDGCPRGSVKAIVTNQFPGNKNADYFQVVYDKFEAKSGEGVKRGDRSNRCNLTMLVDYPKGYRFKFEHSAFKGSAELEEGLTAVFESIYSRPNTRAIRTSTRFKGPFNDSFDVDETGTVTNGFFTGCEGQSILSIQSSIRIKGRRNLEGYVSRDLRSGTLNQKYVMKWEKC